MPGGEVEREGAEETLKLASMPEGQGGKREERGGRVDEQATRYTTAPSVLLKGARKSRATLLVAELLPFSTLDSIRATVSPSDSNGARGAGHAGRGHGQVCKAGS